MPHFKQLDAGKWIKGITLDAACLRAKPRELTLSHGIQFNYDEGGWGLGDIDVALLETTSGRPFGLIHYRQAGYTKIVVDESLVDVSYEVNEIMCDLELRSSDMIWFSPERYQFQPYTLMRVDDNGNHVPMREYDCYPDAFFDQRVFEKRGHKQAYFIQIGEAMPKGWTGLWEAGI